MIGQIVNYRYEVLEKIGDGELFAVYKARDKVLNRLVALKVLTKDFAGDREFAADVASGYQDVAGLTHPSIARVLDADRGADDCVVASEFARGTNVKDRVRRAGPVAVPLALDIIIPVLEALEYAHASRITHGDIRPQDIVVSPDGEVKLTDFGLSTALARHPLVAAKLQMRSLHYQAPEIIEGGLPTAQSDIYSVGVVLYEMLTSTLPFDGTSAVAIALKKVKEIPTPPRSINAAIPKSLSDVVMQAIEAKPQDRYPSASTVLADLRSLRDALRVGQPGAAHVAAERPPAPVAEYATSTVEESLMRRYWWLLAVFVLTVLIAGGGAWMVQRQSGEIRVPPLLGKTWDEAQYEANDKSIILVDDGRVYSESYEEGKICSVMPPAGSAVPRDNPVVKVKISQGPSQVSIPDLTGATEASANEMAAESRFTIGKVKEEYSDKVPINSVISQDPPAGVKRSPNAAIDLVISLGPKPEATPAPDNTGNTTGGGERRFMIKVEVPQNADGQQDVVIKVIDDNGENTAYEETHNPGDKFSTPVVTVGKNVRIRVFVGGQLMSDSVY